MALLFTNCEQGAQVADEHRRAIDQWMKAAGVQEVTARQVSMTTRGVYRQEVWQVVGWRERDDGFYDILVAFLHIMKASPCVFTAISDERVAVTVADAESVAKVVEALQRARIIPQNTYSLPSE